MLDRAHRRVDLRRHRRRATAARERLELRRVLASRARTRRRWRRRPRTGGRWRSPRPTLSGVRPPDRITGDGPAVGPRELPGERLAGAARPTGHVAVEQVEVGVERRQRLDVGAAADPRRLDHLAAGAPRRPRRRTTAPRRRAAGPSSGRAPRRSARRRPASALTNTPATSAPALKRRGDLGGGGELAAARRARARRSARPPRRRRRAARSASRMDGDAAELDLRGASPRPHRRASQRASSPAGPDRDPGGEPELNAAQQLPQAASMSGARISASPISTASMPASAEPRELLGAAEPGLGHRDVPAGSEACSRAYGRVSTSSVVRSRLLIPMIRGAELDAPPRARAGRGPRPARRGRARRASACSSLQLGRSSSAATISRIASAPAANASCTW